MGWRFWRREKAVIESGGEGAMEQREGEEEAVSVLVMREMLPHFTDYSGVKIWFSGRYDPAEWEPQFQAQERKLRELRAWVDSLPNNAFKHAYLRWISYFQCGIGDARKELSTHRLQIEDREFKQRRRQESDAFGRLSGAVPKPPL